MYCQLFFVITFLIFSESVVSFTGVSKFNQKTRSSTRSLNMFELEANSMTYAGIFVATIIPSLAFVKFVGDAADGSRDNLSEETKQRFKKAMMEQPGQNFALPSSEEEELKRQIAKAYMQDKDVDVAVLEAKLKKRAEWRKEMISQSKKNADAILEDEDGW